MGLYKYIFLWTESNKLDPNRRFLLLDILRVILFSMNEYFIFIHNLNQL